MTYTGLHVISGVGRGCRRARVMRPSLPVWLPKSRRLAKMHGAKHFHVHDTQ